MPPLKPVVFEPVDLVAFIQYLLDEHVQQTTLIVCSTKEAFVQQLIAATAAKANPPAGDSGEGNPTNPTTLPDAEASSRQSPRNPWTIPTLRLLASSQTVKLAFCPDVTHLRAYLTTYAHQLSKTGTKATTPQQQPNAVSALAVLNPIQLHKPTSAFSAQGLNRTLAVAVEAAHQAKRRLVLAECATFGQQDTHDEGEGIPGHEDGDVANALEDEVSPWDEEVSILNVTTKTFGAGERGWVGRTVKIRAVAARWSEFRTLPVR